MTLVIVMRTNRSRSHDWYAANRRIPCDPALSVNLVPHSDLNVQSILATPRERGCWADSFGDKS